MIEARITPKGIAFFRSYKRLLAEFGIPENGDPRAAKIFGALMYAESFLCAEDADPVEVFRLHYLVTANDVKHNRPTCGCLESPDDILAGRIGIRQARRLDGDA